MTGTFKNNNPANTFVLLIYGLLLKLPMFLHPATPKPQVTDGFLYRELLLQFNKIAVWFPAVYSVIAFLLLFTQAIVFNQLANTQRLMVKSNYLIAMSYLLITSLFKEWNTISAPLLVGSVMIWLWARLSALNTIRNVTAALFNAGMVLGIASFFYFPAVAFAGLLILGLLIIRPFKAAEWVLALLGILTPWYFLFSVYFLTDRLNPSHFPVVHLGIPRFVISLPVLAAILTLLFTAGTGLFFIRKYFFRQLVQTRNSWSLVFLFFLISAGIPFINGANNFTPWILCVVPLSSAVAAAFFYPEVKWFPKMLHWLLVAFTAVFGYYMIK